MAIKCPQCNDGERLTKLRQPFHFTFGQLLLGLLGGAIGGMFWALGQETKFQCGRCSHVFFSHTRVSRVFFVLCVLVYTVVAAAICYGVWTALVS